MSTVNLQDLMKSVGYQPLDDEAVLAPMIDLSSRDAYLAWVATWKAAYRTITLHQRYNRGRGEEPLLRTEYGVIGEHRTKLLAITLLNLRALGKRLSWAARCRKREEQPTA